MAIPYYRWFPGDYARDTRHLSLMQHGVYRLLIDLYMDHGTALRNDLPYLYRWLHAESVEEKNSVEFILTEFFILKENVWRHKRCEYELKWQQTKSGGARESANKRWHNEGDANAMRTHSERYANQNQNQNQNQRKSKPPTSLASSKPETPRGKLTSAVFTAPGCVDPELWKDFLEHRKAKRAPLTKPAVSLITKDLENMDDPNEALKQSIKNGWTGIFKPRQDKRNGIEEWVRQSTEKDITNEC